MSFFDNRSEGKWVKSKRNTHWNRLFSRTREEDALITKCMVYNCVCFADKLLSSNVFKYENMMLRMEIILLAKMHFYHCVTKTQTVHSLFYGYIFELYVNHYKENNDTAYSVLHHMRAIEYWYINEYYDFFNKTVGNFESVIDRFYGKISTEKTVDGESVLNVDEKKFKNIVSQFLVEMHNDFISDMPK